MAKKTTDKKSADKKDTGKKPNAGKDADDSKVRRFVLVGVDPSSMCMRQGGGKLKAATSINVRHILCEVGLYLRRQASSHTTTFSRNTQRQAKL